MFSEIGFVFVAKYNVMVLRIKLGGIDISVPVTVFLKCRSIPLYH